MLWLFLTLLSVGGGSVVVVVVIVLFFCSGGGAVVVVFCFDGVRVLQFECAGVPWFWSSQTFYASTSHSGKGSPT